MFGVNFTLTLCLSDWPCGTTISVGYPNAVKQSQHVALNKFI